MNTRFHVKEYQKMCIHERSSFKNKKKIFPLDSWIKLNKNDEGGKKNEIIASLFEAEYSGIYKNIKETI